MLLNKPHHLAQQRRRAASPNQVPMYSFTSLRRQDWRYAEEKRQKRRPTATTNRICKKKETQKMNALKREDQQSNVSETGDLRECLYIVNFDTTIETDTFLWRSLRLIWCSCQGAKRGAAGD